MTRQLICVAATTIISWTASPGAAQQVRAGADASASVGMSSNPFLVEGGEATVFVDGVIAPGISISDERGSSSIGGYLRGTAYADNGYDPTWAIGAAAQSNRAVTERLSLRGSLQVDSTIIGEKFNSALVTAPTFLPTPSGADSVQPGSVTPVTPVPATAIAPPPQFIGSDITLLGSRQRQTTFGGSVGANYRLSAREAVYADLQAQRSVTGGRFFSFSSYGGTVGYSRSVSELTQVGVRLSSQWTHFDDGGTGEVHQPQLTLDTQLSPLWRLSAGAGIPLSKSRTPIARGSATSLSGNLRLCRDGERSEFCLRGSRDAGPNGLGVVSRQLSVGASYSMTLSEDESVRSSLDYSQVNTPGNLVGASDQLFRGDNSFMSASAAYDRRLGRRLRAGLSASFRRADAGAESASDVSASVFLSTRLGAVR